VTDFLDAIATWLDRQGLITYRPEGTDGDTFLDGMPSSPDQAVSLTLYGDGEPDPENTDDQVSLQVRVRGTANRRPSYQRAWAIYSALHGATDIPLADGTWLTLAVAKQVPTSMGIDGNGRHEHTTNYRITVTNQTANRT
jgi:hypothetical protein